MRIAKFIALSGICSRREAERMILEGRVYVDNVCLDSPAFNVKSENIIKVDGKLISNNIPEIKLWLYHKPIGLINTHQDPQNRRTVFDSLKNRLPRVISVGRLDLNSEGLLLLTNNGDLARYLESPKNNIKRVYKVRVFAGGKVLTNIYNKTITIDNISYNIDSIEFISQKGKNIWYKVTLYEGKNREIRKIFNHFGFEVSRLIRIGYGCYSLSNLEADDFKEVKINEDYLRAVQK